MIPKLRFCWLCNCLDTDCSLCQKLFHNNKETKLTKPSKENKPSHKTNNNVKDN